MNRHGQDEDTLHWQLQRLRRDVEPGADLWPGIAARLSAKPQQPARGQRRRLRRSAPWAMAASILLAVGVVWQLGHQAPDRAPSSVEPLVLQEAQSMTQQYQRDLAGVQQAETHPEMATALEDLDRSAAQILSAIARDPNASFLLDQLRRTYVRRLQLTQRALIT
jgi:hypothetical protein